MAHHHEASRSGGLGRFPPRSRPGARHLRMIQRVTATPLAVVLDGVLDDSGEVLESWQGRLPLRVLRSREPPEASSALNHGFAAGRGQRESARGRPRSASWRGCCATGRRTSASVASSRRGRPGCPGSSGRGSSPWRRRARVARADSTTPPTSPPSPRRRDASWTAGARRRSRARASSELRSGGAVGRRATRRRRRPPRPRRPHARRAGHPRGWSRHRRSAPSRPRSAGG